MLHLSVCIANTGEERGELLGGVTPIHVEGENTAVLAPDFTDKTPQLSLVIVPGRAVATYERLARWHLWYNAI